MDNTFSYQNLEREIRKVIPRASIVNGSHPARVALGVGVLGAISSLAATIVLSGPWQEWIVIPGFVLEILGFGIYFFYELKSEIPWFRKAKDEFPAALDANYSAYVALIVWIRRYPLHDVQMRLDHLRVRQESMARRMGLVVGAMDRFGILPVAVAVYLQLNNAGWPPKISVFQGLLAIFLFGVYALCHWLSWFKINLDFYVSLLASATRKSG